MLNFIDWQNQAKCTISQQNLLLCEAHLCSGVVLPMLILVIFFDVLLHWTEQNFERDMVTVRKYNVISFEIQTADMQ